eukprot:13594096-Alexandrium_andersonii.AAC.1
MTPPAKIHSLCCFTSGARPPSPDPSLSLYTKRPRTVRVLIRNQRCAFQSNLEAISGVRHIEAATSRGATTIAQAAATTENTTTIMNKNVQNKTNRKVI